MTHRRLGRVVATCLAVAWGGASTRSTPARLASAQQNAPRYTTSSELVLLNVTVRDHRREFVTGLTREAFMVYDGGRPRPIRFFLNEDAPATIGLLIDTSGSMLPMRSLVISAVSAFADTSNPLDEFFAITFDDDVRRVLPSDAPFTGEPAVLVSALRGALHPRGRTSLYDAVAQGAAYAEDGSHQRKVLVVVSDGADTASTVGFDRMRRQVQASNVVVYGIRLTDPAEPPSGERQLREVATATGGEVLVPRHAAQVAESFGRIARAIRHAYVLAFEPAAGRSARFHTIRVAVRPPGSRGVTVQTRSGYWGEDAARREAPRDEP